VRQGSFTDSVSSWFASQEFNSTCKEPSSSLWNSQEPSTLWYSDPI